MCISVRGDCTRAVLGLGVLLVLPLLIMSCASTGRPAGAQVSNKLPPLPVLTLFIDQAFEQRSVRRANCGSAVQISDHLFITAAHLLADSTDLTIEGTPGPHRVLFAGDATGQTFEHDWAIIQSATKLPGNALPFWSGQPTPRVGQTVVIAGLTEVDGERVIVQGVCTLVNAPSPLQDSDDRLLYFKGPSGGGGFPGMSGGPVAIWNEQTEQYQIIGIHVGTVRTSVLGFRTTSRDVGIIRPITHEEVATILSRVHE